MSQRTIRLLGTAAVVVLSAASHTGAAQVTPEQALGLKPIQSDVDFDLPDREQAAKCTVKAKTDNGASGWVVLDPAGQLLRRFLDTNGDNRVDLWCYCKAGIEVYRDIDSNFNGKADQYRWLGTGGIRWGLDNDEDGRIDHWKMISAEEVTAEVVAALRTRDSARFGRLLPSDVEIASLGLGETQRSDVSDMVGKATSGFSEMARRQTAVTDQSIWLNFGASQPGVVPAGTDGSTKDLIVYDNVSAIVETDGKHEQIAIGTLVKVEGGWRVINLPTNIGDSQTASLPGGYFFQQAAFVRSEAVADSEGISEEIQKLIRDLESVEKALEAASSPQQLAKLNASRADVLARLVESASNSEEREAWIRQFADSVSAAVQSGGYPDGVQRLKSLSGQLQKAAPQAPVTAYVEFRYQSAKYAHQLAQPNADYAKIQDQWLTDLRDFVKAYPKGEDAAEAMLQLAVGEEFAGKTDEAITWYGRIVQQFADSTHASKAAGAKRRLESVGKSISVQGATLDGKSTSLAQYRGRTVLIHYWATWCEPCKQDMTLLKQLQAKYARQGFALIGVNLDSDRETAVRFLQSNSLPWPHLFEPGGLDSRLATELGILTLPTMILVGKDGTVLNRNIHAAELDEELKKRLR
jgi:thiol-disulfide isomerase/thioredoxin